MITHVLAVGVRAVAISGSFLGRDILGCVFEGPFDFASRVGCAVVYWFYHCSVVRVFFGRYLGGVSLECLLILTHGSAVPLGIGACIHIVFPGQVTDKHGGN